MRNHDIDRPIRDAGERAGEKVRQYADGAAGQAQTLYDRGRQWRDRFSQRGDTYSRRLSHKAEDFADEANYHYRRLRRQVNRNPGTTAAIVVGTLGAFMLLRHIFRSNDDE